jgi:tetratricopeptide (TPR) repeat protein
MKFVCPVCKTAGDIPENDSVQPVGETICRKCRAHLSIERETGRVQPLAADRDLQASQDPSPHRPKYAASPVLSMRPQDKGKKDHLAAGVFAVVLSALVATGVYFSLNIDRGILKQPLQKFSGLVDEVSRYGKTILDEIQKARQPKSKKNRQVQNHVRKGYQHYKENQPQKAVKELSQAIEIDPQNLEAYFWRARAFIRLGQLDQAIADLNEVVHLDPSYSPAYDNLGWVYMRRTEYDESLANLNKSIELKPDNGWAHYMRGRIFFKKGQMQKAFDNASTACKLGYNDACRDARHYKSQLAEKG